VRESGAMATPCGAGHTVTVIAIKEEAFPELEAVAGTLRVAFLSNHKPNAELIQRRVADRVRARYGSRVEIEHHEKPNMALPAPTDVLRAIAERASLLVSGSGD